MTDGCTEEMIKRAIYRKHWVQGLVVEVGDGWVTLGGTCNSFYFKQLIQEAVKPLLDGSELLNGIQVSSEETA